MSRTRLHITVAAVVVFNDRFLFVEERDKIGGHKVLNQPAGHMEEDEDIVQAICREVFEETGLQLEPTAWLGISQLKSTNDHTYIRINFLFEPSTLPANYQPQDSDILALHWLSAAELLAQPIPVRSKLVTDAIECYTQQIRLPLTLIQPLITL